MRIENLKRDFENRFFNFQFSIPLVPFYGSSLVHYLRVFEMVVALETIAKGYLFAVDRAQRMLAVNAFGTRIPYNVGEIGCVVGTIVYYHHAVAGLEAVLVVERDCFLCGKEGFGFLVLVKKSYPNAIGIYSLGLWLGVFHYYRRGHLQLQFSFLAAYYMRVANGLRWRCVAVVKVYLFHTVAASRQHDENRE